MSRFLIAQLAIGAIFSGMLSMASSSGGEVSGQVDMPSTCSPTVSPAVVSLKRADGTVVPASGPGARVGVVNQRGLQFEPRVQAVQVGQSLEFTNEDNETHNVHILTPGRPFNQSMSRGLKVAYITDKPGVLGLVCDVHSHMRGYVVVSPTPFFALCRPDGRFRIDDVPPGKYRLEVWHEMGKGTSREIEVKSDQSLVVGRLSVEAAPVRLSGSAEAPIRSWPEVTDRISILLGEARAVVLKPAGEKKARSLTDDAYMEEFEGSDMETAIRRHLGFKRSGEVEGLFRGFKKVARDVATGKVPVNVMADRSRELLLALVNVGQELNRLGVTDRTKVELGAGIAADSSDSSLGDLKTQKKALAEAFDGVARTAAAGQADDASSDMATAYSDAFDPLERRLQARRPQEIRPLEARFSALRGRIGKGLKGEALEVELAALQTDISEAIERSQAGGAFVPAFFASLVTILREGVEVILLLTMLISLVAKTGQPKALSAIRWGVASAAVASLVTAIGLNLLVATAQGRTREQIEGWVLMLAAGVLFYVSYWLISQTESKRWTDYLKQQVSKGVAVGGFGTLGLTAFLAVYREGAETALMYQGLISGQAGSKLGLAGVIVGLFVGLAGLTVIYRVIRSTSVRLPLRSFFKLTGFVLFAMAIVFAGNGVFELQSAGILKNTSISWLGSGLPWFGIHPNVQALSVQVLLVAGALIALIMAASDRGDVVAVPERRMAVSEPVPEHASV